MIKKCFKMSFREGLSLYLKVLEGFMKGLRFIVLLLVIIGALNWGMIAFFGTNVIANLLGGMDMTSTKVVFGLIGLAGLYSIGFLCRCAGCGCKCGSNCKCCKK